MTGYLELTPDELASLVCAALAYNGFQAEEIGVYNGGQLVDFDRVGVPYKAQALKVRTVPESDEVTRILALRSVLNSDVRTGTGA